ncbi:MAG: DUF2071 domain-containing protein [Deltaproteobacteria bacterium]|nr:DUF2071 domain-containing protein [Deltaproteobacteria bacterium]
MSHWSAVAKDVAHRSYPPPAAPWVMTMSWCDLCFLHWEVDPIALRALVPAALPLDLREGKAWVAVVPFWMDHVTGRFLPDVPGVSRFRELNVRTYVSLNDQPGVYFFSLDADQALAVWGARTFFSLNYLNAKITCERSGEEIAYDCERDDERAPPGRFVARYRPSGPVTTATPGSLEAFLTDRYCLYTVDDEGLPLRAHIQHGPWPLQPGSCDVDEDTIVPVPLVRSGAPLVHFVSRIDVVGWPIAPVRG